MRLTKRKVTKLTGKKSFHLRFPECFGNQVTCVYCLELFGAKRSDASFCSSQCRQAEYRYRLAMRKKERK